MAKQIIISDLHLANKRKEDVFYQANIITEERLLRFIRRKVLNDLEVDSLIVLGDLGDAWRMGGDWTSIYASYPKVFELLKEVQHQKNFTWVIGNHDASISRPENNPYEFKVLPYHVINGFILLHGHIFDPLNSGVLREIGETVTEIASTVQAITGIELERLLEFKERFRDLPSRNPAIKDEVEARALQWVTSQEQTLIYGHTHRLAGWPNEKVYNTGTWANGNSDFIELFPDGSVKQAIFGRFS